MEFRACIPVIPPSFYCRPMPPARHALPLPALSEGAEQKGPTHGTSARTAVQKEYHLSWKSSNGLGITQRQLHLRGDLRRRAARQEQMRGDKKFLDVTHSAART